MSESPQINDEYRFYLLRKRHVENLILNAFQRFRGKGIEPVLIKGWAAARNYPPFEPRFFSDVDLAVSGADYERARDLVDSGRGIGGVDLHRELRHLDTVDWGLLMSNSELVPLDGEEIRILAAEDHLRVLCVHWLTDGGESRDRLWDIVHAVRNRPAGFDWSKCLDVVSPTRRKWIVSTIGIAHKYMGLELDGLPFANEATPLPTWLTRSLERSWDANIRHIALESQLKNPRNFLQQLRKRIPPNAIQATINCEGDFDDRHRAGYQLRDMVNRFLPSFRRISAAMFEKE